MRALRVARVRARLAGGVDPLQPRLAMRPADEFAGAARQGEFADIVAVMDDKRRR